MSTTTTVTPSESVSNVYKPASQIGNMFTNQFTKIGRTAITSSPKVFPVFMMMEVSHLLRRDEILIDSGAALHVCPWSFYDQYPVRPHSHEISLHNADGTEIEQYGLRWILFEVVSGFYIWVQLLVCNVSHPIFSVAKFEELGVKFNFDGENRCITMPTEDGEVRVPFQKRDQVYFLTPLRVVSYAESLDRYGEFLEDQGYIPYDLQLNPVSFTLSAPVQPGQHDY